MNQTPATDANLFRNEGDFWLITFAGQTVRLRDARGLRYLAQLLQQPGATVSAVVLTDAARVHPLGQRATDSPSPNAVPDADRERARVAVSKAIKAAIERIATVHPSLADHLQATVRRGYTCTYMPDPRVPIFWETAAPVPPAEGQRGVGGRLEAPR